jgi:DNA-binding winged helix-turn-helix (wHTH) protein
MRIRFGRLELDEKRFLLRRGEEQIDLRPKVFDLLLHLIRHRDRVVLRQELVEALWGRTVVGLGSLSGLVNELRQALGESGRGVSSIRTVHARGYQFVAEVEIIDEAAALPPPLADALMAHARGDEPDLETIASWLCRQQGRAQDEASLPPDGCPEDRAIVRTIGARGSVESGANGGEKIGAASANVGERRLKKVEKRAPVNRAVSGGT